MLRELFINDQLCDLRGNEEIAADYALLKIDDIGNRSGLRSYEFQLPKSNTNKTILESAEQVDNFSSLPYSKIKARYLVDGVDTLIRFAEIVSAKDYYNIRLFGATSDFYTDAKGVNIRDLGWCEYDHFWDLNTVVASRLNTDGFIYPIIDNIKNSPNALCDNTTRQIRVDYMHPAIFQHNILDKIATKFGITIDNQVERVSEFPLDRMILPFSSSELKMSDNGDRYEALFYASTDINMNTPISPMFPAFPAYGTWVTFDTIQAACGNYWTGGSAFHKNSTNYLRFAERVRFTVEYDLTIDTAAATGFLYFTTNFQAAFNNFALRTSTNTLEIVWNPTFGVPTRFTGTHVFETELIADENDMGAPTRVYNNVFLMVMGGANSVSYDVLKGGSFIKITNVELLEEPSKIEFRNKNDLVFGTNRHNYFTASSALPDWTCADFLKEYCKQTSSMPIFNFITNTLSLVPFKTVKDNLHKAPDWSGKLDMSEPPEIRFVMDDYAQLSHFIYAEDDTVVKPDGTDLTIEIPNLNLELEKNIVELEYAATATVERLVGLTLPKIALWEYNPDSPTEPTFSSVVQRILVLKKYSSSDFTSPGHIFYNDGTTNIQVNDNLPIPYFIQAGETFNLGFKDNLITVYGQLFLSIILRSKILTHLFRLTAADINQLDFTVPVFIQEYESYFYISRIEAFEFTDNRSTVVELVKLNL